MKSRPLLLSLSVLYFGLIEIQAKEIMRMKKLLNEILAGHTGQDFERVKADTDRDNIMTPQQALEYGIIDEVIGAAPNVEGG